MQLALSRISNNMAHTLGSGQSGKGRYTSVFHFFGLRENPFHISPDPRYLSFNRQTQEAFDAVTYGIAGRQGLIVLTGEVGTGKTTLTNHLLNWLRQRQTPVSFIVNPHLGAGDLFDFMLADFGIPCEADQKADKLALLNSWLFARHRSGQTPILIVDEAHGLPSKVLEEIRLLLNLETAQQKLLQVVLVGQPELEGKLCRPELLKLRQRVTVHCKIGPLNEAETRGYLHRRVGLAGGHVESVFTSDAIDAVHFYSRGIPRVINILCEHALINAYADQLRPVPLQMVKQVAQEFLFYKIGPLEARFDLNGGRSATATSARSISTIVRVHATEAAEPVSTERCNTPLSHIPISASGENFALPAALVAEDAETVIPSIAGRITLGHRWGFLRSASLDVWRRWHGDRIVGTGSILRRAASSVTRWLQQPVPHLQARRSIGLGQRFNLQRCKTLSARIYGEIRKGFARLWHEAKARLES